jgi:signal transduction histidine kinase
MAKNFDVLEDNIYFNRYFRRFLKVLCVIVSMYLIIFTFNILKDNPAYMRDWRGPACIVLSLAILVFYAIPLLLSNPKWPSPLYYSLSIWVSVYLVTVALSFINANFVWDFYIVFGLSFALFQMRLLCFIVVVVAFTTFAFEGLLAWSLLGNNLAIMVGQGMGFFSMTAFCALVQHLIGERFARNMLVQQLTAANVQLEEAHRQLTQSVEQEQEIAVLRERTRLAREMHDTLGHALVLISVKLEAAQRLRERYPERCERELEATKEVARESMSALRASIANLRSPALEQKHIYHVLGRTTRELAQRTGLHIMYTLQADSESLPEAVEETLWKVCLEALTNIEKHAHANNVELCISRHAEKLRMDIHDDGIGLPQDLCQFRADGSLECIIPDGRYGLRGMRERIECIGGHFSLHSGKGQGTTVTIDLPLLPIASILPNSSTYAAT